MKIKSKLSLKFFSPIMLGILISICLLPYAFAGSGDVKSGDPMDADNGEVESQCPANEKWDDAMNMCMEIDESADASLTRVSIHGNAFATAISAQRPRGKDSFAIPNFLMVGIEKNLNERHLLSAELMATIERWTFPHSGYTELLQVGESNIENQPFIDSQHPHSSPVMGLTFSDTIQLPHANERLRIFFAPRGESTDGPVAFMHRPTGVVNPDAPLGHHVGQDVGHISSTVIGAGLTKDHMIYEISTFNGHEPEPDRVDLPIYVPNSLAARVTRHFSKTLFAMASLAYVGQPESNEPELDHLWRYSASTYYSQVIRHGWRLEHALVYGLINGLDGAGALNSFLYELSAKKNRRDFWGRLEVLQRTPDELAIAGVQNPSDGRWIEALTTGYTYQFATFDAAQLGLGGSVTADILPSGFQSAYGGGAAYSARIFLQLSAMKAFDF